MNIFILFLDELLRALTVFIIVALGLEFLKEGLVSNALDLHTVVVATIILYGVKLFVQRLPFTPAATKL